MLAVNALCKSFGPIAALSEVSLSIGQAEIRAICGENGAGKSTLVKLLTGINAPDAGTIAIDGVVRHITHPWQAQALGIGLVAQELSLAPNLSVLDNIWLGSREVPLFHRRQKLRQRAAAALETLGASHLGLDTPVGALTIGQRQLVEIARLLARSARLLILDEPSATLSDVEIERMFQALIALKAERKSVIYITHRLGEVFEICDSVTVLRNGKHVGTLPVGAVDRRRLIEMMLDRSLGEMYPEGSRRTAAATPMLSVEGLRVPGTIKDFSMVVPRGQIVCIAGQIGSGAIDVIRALAGLVHDATGRVTIDGAALALGSVPRALSRNVQFVSEDRAGEGLFVRMRVADNLVATRLEAHARYGILSWRQLRATAGRLAEQVGVDRARLAANADELSGGNQQKLAFGRAIDRREPGVLLMNEPTRGVDVGARAEIYRLMRAFCDQGYALVIASTDLEEVLGVADTIVTMYRGCKVETYARDEVSMGGIVADITHPRSAAEIAA